MRFLLLLSFIFSLHIFSEPEQDFYLECKNSFGWFDRINEKHIFFYSKDTKELKWHSIISMGTKKNFLFSYPLHFSGESTYTFRSKKKFDRNKGWNDVVDSHRRFYPNRPETRELKKKAPNISYNFLHLDRKELTMSESTGNPFDSTFKCRKIWYWTYLWKTRNYGKSKVKEKPNRI